jgi:peptidyl-prolyl cis-trans isomerase SurA
MQQVSVSDADVERYLDNQSRRFARGHQYHLRQIRLDLPGQANATVTGVARDRLLQLRKKIIQGKLSFADAAHSVSEGAHAAAGGDLGWVSGAQLPDRFDSALAGLSSGQISPVFQGPKGLYLIKLEGERGGQKDPDHQHQVMVTEVHLRHLILKPNEIRNDARTRELVENLYKRLQAGGDFASLARQYSDDKATAQQGGDVGWIALKRIPSQTRQRIEGLHKGDISRILKTGDGYEIIKLLDRRHSDKTEQARRNKARQALGQKRAREKGKLWLHQLRDEAYIDIRMPDYKPTPGSPGLAERGHAG